MAELNVYDAKGKQVDTYKLDPKELAPRINKQLLHDVCVMYQANQRQGSAKTKSRAEVSASTRKLYRQKGTGNARAGMRSSGVRRAGGHIHAKRPRDYSYQLPRKAIQLATRMALAAKVQDDELVVIDKLEFDAPKTRDMASILKALGIDGVRLLIATDGHDVNVYKSARNIDRVTVSPNDGLNALAILNAQRVLVTKGALDQIRKRVTAGAGNAKQSSKS